MNCKYSILYSGKSLSALKLIIDEYLHNGIKVIWFGTENDCKYFENKYPDFLKTFLLQPYIISSNVELEVIDGDINNDFHLLEKIHHEAPAFNYEQYLIEHSKTKHQIVKASAGTGKTSVTIDRVMFLLHTVPNLKPSQISMITFTNDAADQMNQRLQDALLTRYNLCHNPFYLSLLEQQSQMMISTIHSFAYSLLKILGITLGYTNSLSIRSFKHELDAIIAKKLDEELNSDATIRDQIGVPLHLALKISYKYWHRLVELGYSHKDIMEFDWGDGKDTVSQSLQIILIKTICSIDSQYDILKRKNNAVSLIDILRDLDCVLEKNNPRLETIDIKYLFVDEFQDSDNSQIEVIAKLASLLDISLFVVGDVKQSIYRFRGADDTAFLSFVDKLKQYGCEKPFEYHLVNNYRTSPAIMNRLHSCFTVWGNNGVLEYDSESKPYQTFDGSILFRSISPHKDVLEVLVNDIRDALNDLNNRLQSKKTKPSDKVVILSRTNSKLSLIGKICRSNGIPVVVKQDGNFYTSDAVRDFYSLISSFIYRDSTHIFNYLISPYSSLNCPIDIDILRKRSSCNEKIIEELQNYLKQTSWKKYDDKIHQTPILTIIKEIVDTEPLIANYAKIMKNHYLSDDISIDAVNKQTFADCKQYKANLDKLLEIIQQKINSDHSDIFDLHDFLNIMISTNRDESYADVDDEFDSSYVYCTTVHKAKGLEFDTVMLPFTNGLFRIQQESDIVIDDYKKELGWKYYDNEFKLMNESYDRIQKRETLKTRAEECRILYVALTRAIKKLYIYTKQDFKNNTWADLLNIGGLDH